jgi:hypothetical protein
LHSWILEGLEDELDGLKVSTETGQHQTVVSINVLDSFDVVFLGPVVEEDLEDVRTTLSLTGLHQGRLILVVLELDVGSFLDEFLDHQKMVLKTRDHEGSEAIIVLGVDVHLTLVDEDLHNLMMSFRASHHQDIPAKERFLLEISSLFDEEGDEGMMARETGSHEGSEALLVRKVDVGSSGNQLLGDGEMSLETGHVDGSDTSGSKKVGVRSLFQQQNH